MKAQLISHLQRHEAAMASQQSGRATVQGVEEAIRRGRPEVVLHSARDRSRSRDEMVAANSGALPPGAPPGAGAK